MSATKYCNDPDHCTYSDCPTAFCDRSSDHSFAPPPGEYIEVDEDEGSKYPLHVNYDTWLSEEEGATLLKELQAAMDYLTTKRQNAQAQ